MIRRGVEGTLMVVVAALVLMAGLGAIPQARAGAAVSGNLPQVTFTVSGWVTDALSFLPLANATVQTATGVSTTTDGSGFYTLAVQKGPNTFTIAARGFHTTNFGITVNANMPNQNRTLRPYTFAITGSVIDARTNLGVPGAVVLLTPIGLTNRTSATGTYRILTENGSFTMEASAPGYAAQQVNLTVRGFPLTQYFVLQQATGTASGPTPIELVAIAVTIGLAAGVIGYLAVALREGERLRHRPQFLAGIAASRFGLRERPSNGRGDNLSDRRRRRGP